MENKHRGGGYIFVIDIFHQNQLSVGAFGMGLVLKGSTEFLNGNVSFKYLVIGRAKDKKKEMS